MRNARAIATRRQISGNLTGLLMLPGLGLALYGVLAGDNLSGLQCGICCIVGTWLFWQAFTAHLNR